MNLRFKEIFYVGVVALWPMMFAQASTPSIGNHFKKVVWIVFENESANPTFAQADFAKFASYGAALINMHAENHPSQENYIAMIAGSTLGVSSDSPVSLSQKHIGDLLENAGQDWHVYAEDYPGNCFTKTTSGRYVRKHVPFLSFQDVTSNSQQCAKITDSTQFMNDFNQGTLPEFSMYVPNLDNDGHDTGLAYAGNWLTTNFDSILSRPDQMGDILFILTFDESLKTTVGNPIYSVLIGKNIVPGSNSQLLNHPALLKMVEDELGLGNLGLGDKSAPSILGIWKN